MILPRLYLPPTRPFYAESAGSRKVKIVRLFINSDELAEDFVNLHRRYSVDGIRGRHLRRPGGRGAGLCAAAFTVRRFPPRAGARPH